MTSQDSYCVVFDTSVEYLPKDFSPSSLESKKKSA